MKREVVCHKQTSTRTISVQVADGEQFVHRDGTNHPVTKRDHVVKHDPIEDKTTALIQGGGYR